MQPKHVTFSLLLIISVMLIPLHVHANETSQITSTNIFLNVSFTLPSAGGDACDYRDISINIWAGTEIVGTIKSNSEIFFFVMNETQFNLADQKCMHNVSSDKILATGPLTSYTLDWTAQNDDKYHFILLNRSSSDVSISVTLWTLQNS